jgi:hypothetical protein
MSEIFIEFDVGKFYEILSAHPIFGQSRTEKQAHYMHDYALFCTYLCSWEVGNFQREVEKKVQILCSVRFLNSLYSRDK